MKINKLNRLWFLLLLAFAIGGCNTSEVDEATLSLGATSVSANKRGMTYEGGDVTFEVQSNVYWVINPDADADWLTVTPRAAFGNQIVKVTAGANSGAARSTTLHFDSRDGVTAEIVVTQGAFDELIYFVRTGVGTTPVSGDVPLGEFTGWEKDGVGASDVKFSGTNAFVSAARASSGYEGASGSNGIRLTVPAMSEYTPTSSFTVTGAATKENLYFRLKIGVLAPTGLISPETFRILISDGGDEYVDLSYEQLGNGEWQEVLARFYVNTDTKELNFRIQTSGGEYCIDDFRLYEGNSGEGEEVVFKVGADDGKEAGHVYFEDDFGWVTAVYGGTDYIGTYPNSETAEQYWNEVTAAKFGQEAYDALINSGWTTDDNKLKERIYLRIGYIKMGRGSNASGCGGGLVSPQMDIKKNCTAKLKVSFDCCTYVTGKTGVWDPARMQVRIIGPGTINDESSTVKTFLMQTTTPVKWETKEFLVNGATAATQIVFESVDETTANRWFFDNVHIVKASASDRPEIELTPLTAPTIVYDEKASTESSVKFTWEAVQNAATYEYHYTCLNCGEEVESRSGKTTEPNIEFSDLLAGTTCRLKVRTLPAENDPLYDISAWSDPAEGRVKAPVQEQPDAHPVGYAFIDDDLSWVTQALYGQEDFVGNFPSSAAGVRFDNTSEIGKATLAEKGWTMTAANSAAYLYAGSFKLGTASAVGSVFTPVVSGVDEGAKINATVTVGGTAFLGTNSFYDDDTAAISIVGEGTFDDGSTLREFRLNSWNDWVRHTFVVRGINNATKFRIESRTAAKGRLLFNYFSVVKLADDYNPAAQLPVLETPTNVAITANTAYGFDASWTAVANATDYTYFVMLPNGQTVATGKTWESRVHIGGLAGRNLSATYPYFNFRVVANHMNYNSSKVEIPQTYTSSATSRAVKATITPSAATVYFQDDFSWSSAASSSVELAKMTDWINTYCTVDYMPRLDKLVAEGVVSLNGWDCDAKNVSVYTRPGYLHINASSTLGNLISPALSGIAGSDDVLVSFDATYFFQYFSGATDGKTFTARLNGAGAIDGASGGVISFTLTRGNAWESFSFRITGADATTQIIFAPAVASKNRVQFDNFRAESLTR